MSRPFSAYAVLELMPGADREAVETAYRRLIKLHHPDRNGGDGTRAAEINRAYFELRSLPAAPAPFSQPRRRQPRRKHRRWTLRWSILLLALVPLALMQGDLMRQAQWGRGVTLGRGPIAVRSKALPNSALDAPVDDAVVARSVSDALRLVRDGDKSALVEESRDCHRRMRAEPNVARLDRCAAFDTAVVALEDRDPNHDTGPFNASSVTARQMTAASLLSDDYLAIERRLNRIRSEVELALKPPAPLPPPVAVDEPEKVEIEP